MLWTSRGPEKQNGNMADVFSIEKRSEIMSRIKSRGNLATEVKLVGIFRRNSIVGWRRHVGLFGSPDFVFRKARVVVFIDGCFWHGCADHGSIPKSNRLFWRSKIRRNQERDELVVKTLRKQGWRVLRIWQHELRRENELLVVRRVQTALRAAYRRRGIPQKTSIRVNC